jgi:beta-phosphoglucomutase-like phosphatase (HAD superfamily)
MPALFVELQPSLNQRPSCVLRTWLLLAGVRAAVAAGVPCFGITSGQDPAVLIAAGCCMLIQDYYNLLKLAEQQGAGCAQQQQQQQLGKAAAQNQQQHVVTLTADSR